jgi:heptosyltransferase I
LVDLNRIERVLMVRLSAIGDVVHTMPVAAALKRTFPHLHVTWAVEERCVPMVEMNRYVDSVFSIPRHRWRKQRWQPRTLGEMVSLFRSLRSGRYQLALDLQGLLKSAVVARFCGAPARLGYHWQREGASLLIKAAVPRADSTHVVEQYLDVVRGLGAVAEPIDFGIEVPNAPQESAKKMLGDLGVTDGYAVINPSAGAPGKRWPPERFAEITDRFEERGLPVVLVGHRLDAPIEQAISAEAKSPVRSLVGKTDLQELTAVLAGAVVHLSGDTGSAHIAAAMRVPVISLFGPTDPNRSGPYGQLSNALSRYCADESKASISGISVDEVWSRLEPYVPEVRQRA